MMDDLFYERFGIETTIKYCHDVILEKGLGKLFYGKWNPFFSKNHSPCPEYREKSFLSFFRRLEKNGDDILYCNRVFIRYIDSTFGYGVFASEDIAPYSILNHYAGQFRLDKEIEESHDSVFSFNDFGGFSIDGSKMGNWTRFINHGEADSNNVISWEVYLPQGPRIIFTSSHRGILKGEQLLYHYGDQYWD